MECLLLLVVVCCVFVVFVSAAKVVAVFGFLDLQFGGSIGTVKINEIFRLEMESWLNELRIEMDNMRES